MKAVLISSVLAGLGVASVTDAAMAADLVTKAPKPVTVANWTGFYLGGGGGYGIANERISAASNAGLSNTGTDSGLAGYFGTVSGGYDYQFASRYVAGVFASYDFSDTHGTETLASARGQFNPFLGREKLSSTLAVGGRIGWLMDPETLLYVSGGYSRARFDGFRLEAEGVAVLPGMRTVDGRNTSGWFIGAGTESKLNFPTFLPGNNWYLRAEYRYAEYDAKTPRLNDPTGAFGPLGAPIVTFKPVSQTVRTELVYKFNSGGGASYAASAPMYVKASAPPPSWTGLYVGGGGGYGFAKVNTVATVGGIPTGDSVDGGARGGFGTISVGYDQQLSPRIVAGVLANYDFANIKGVQDEVFYNLALGAGAGNLKLSSSWGVGGRIGWLATPSTLSYVSGGYTEAKFDATNVTNISTSAFVDTLDGHNHKGYFVGSGIESKLDFLPGNNWFLKTEYRYAAYDRVNANFGGGDFNSFKPVVQTVRMELNYKFNFLSQR